MRRPAARSHGARFVVIAAAFALTPYKLFPVSVQPEEVHFPFRPGDNGIRPGSRARPPG